MKISVEELSPVDKELTIFAEGDDVQPQIDAAYKKYKNQITMPGFRPGRVPLSIIRKRFGDAIEQEEVGKYVQKVYEKEIVPEYEPIGETEMLDLTWEDGKLEAKFKIGTKPDFELASLSEIEVDRMVHDVTDEEAEKEIDRIIRNNSDWEEVEEKITEEHRVIVDAQALDEKGNIIEDDVEEDQVLDLKDEGNEKFLKALQGKEKNDSVTVEFGEDDETQSFEITVKKIEKMHEQELTEEFIKEQTNGEAETVDEFKSFVKSRIQQYYDQAANDMFKRDLVDAMVEAHDFEIPEVYRKQLLDIYLNQAKQRSGGELPEDFNEEKFRENNKKQAERDGKWQLINEKLQEHFDDIEIKPEDIDAYLAEEGARYGISADQMKQIYAQNAEQLERLRTNIREDKVFDRLTEEVTINELPKEEYKKKHEAKNI